MEEATKMRAAIADDVVEMTTPMISKAVATFTAPNLNQLKDKVETHLVFVHPGIETTRSKIMVIARVAEII